jgi:hypothetical protein
VFWTAGPERSGCWCGQPRCQSESAGESSEEDCLCGARQFAAGNAVQYGKAKPEAHSREAFDLDKANTFLQKLKLLHVTEAQLATVLMQRDGADA